MKALDGKVALVTGVGRRSGIGYAVCTALAKKGASIFYTYWRAYDEGGNLQGSQEDPVAFAAEFQKCGGQAAAFEADLSDSETPAQLMREVVRTFGTPDMLINNACVSTRQSFMDVDAALLDAHYAVNVRAAVLLCREFVQHFRKETGGRIVNLTSGQSLGIMEGELPYAITKAGLEMLTLQLELELRTLGITINAVDPGPTDTGWITDEIRTLIESDPKAGKIRTPDEAAALVLSFIHGEREAVTGTILHANRLQEE